MFKRWGLEGMEFVGREQGVGRKNEWEFTARMNTSRR